MSMRSAGRIFFALLIAVSGLSAQEFTPRLEKPKNVFFYPQLNLHGGYDSNEPADGWGLADRGSKTQVALEWFIKARRRLQVGYTRLIQPESVNVKFGIELDPKEQRNREPEPRLRLYDVWAKFDTKWDRTSFWIGHKSIPYGHNPQLDPQHIFLPNQSSLDLGFSRDTGAFFQMPVTAALDWEVSATLGMGDAFDYYDGWLVTSRLGTPTFYSNEVGVFVLSGRVQRTRGTFSLGPDLIDASRAGADWVLKHGDTSRMVNQVSGGTNEGDRRTDDRGILNLLNSYEWYASRRWTFGATHALRFEDFRNSTRTATRGEFFGTISYALDRNTRLRINPFAEYRDTAGPKDEGVMVQVCIGCGLIK